MIGSAPLPIDDVLGALRSALADHSSAVLVARPGAGKTTRAPLALLDEPWAKAKRLILLEPRRIAARAAAARMAATLGEKVGETIGLRVRLTSLVSKRTHIEVVTYGEGGDSQGLLRALMVTAGRRGTRPLHFALAVARHPKQALDALVKDWIKVFKQEGKDPS